MAVFTDREAIAISLRDLAAYITRLEVHTEMDVTLENIERAHPFGFVEHLHNGNFTVTLKIRDDSKMKAALQWQFELLT